MKSLLGLHLTAEENITIIIFLCIIPQNISSFFLEIMDLPVSDGCYQALVDY